VNLVAITRKTRDSSAVDRVPSGKFRGNYFEIFGPANI
jgi:hypothetical protein